MLATVYVGVGSNLDPTRHIPLALAALAREVEVCATSTFYWSNPASRAEQPRFLNGVWKARTDREARELKFDVLRPIEHALGRRRSVDKHAARCIDLDLLVYDDLVVDEEGLVLPDPDIVAHNFLHTPLFELDPDLEKRFPPLPLSAPAQALESDEAFTRRLRDSLADLAEADRP